MADRKPKQPPKYPRKLRMTLEKVAQGKAGRETGEAPKTDALSVVLDTLWHEFLPPNSVHLMYSRIDEAPMRISTVYHLSATQRPELLSDKPPFLAESPTSE